MTKWLRKWWWGWHYVCSNAKVSNAPIWLNLATNTPILDRPARGLFFAPIAKYLDKILPTWTDPDVSIWSPNVPNTDWTDWSQNRFMFAFANLSSLLLFIDVMYIISLLSKFSPGPLKKKKKKTENTRTVRKLPHPQPTRFMDPEPDRPPN